MQTRVHKDKEHQKLRFLLQLCIHLEPHLCPPITLKDLCAHSSPQSELSYYFDHLSRSLKTELFKPEHLLSDLQEAHVRFELNRLLHEPPEPISTLAVSFEKIAVEQSHKNKQGVFYTPREAAQYMATSLTFSKSTTVLDPACGGGIFLLEAAKALFSACNACSYRQKINLLKTQVFGIDRNFLAVEVTRLCLLLCALKDHPAQKMSSEDLLLRSIRTGNTILHPEDDTTGTFRGFDPENAFGAKTFDIILGNPPYGLSRGEQIAPEENRILKSKYKDFLSGKPNKYLLFLARACTLLARGGQLRFLIPNAWLGIKSGRNMRAYLLTNRLLTNIDIFEHYLFPDAGVEVVIASIEKSHAADSFTVTKVRDNYLVEDAYRLPYSYTLNLHDAYIPANWNTEILEAIESIQEFSLPLESYFIPSIALQAYATGKGIPPQTKAMVSGHVFHSNAPIDTTSMPYLQGKDIERFSINWSGSYLRHGKWLADPQDVRKYRCPRVLVREILGEMPCLLQAAYVEEPYLYNKSVLHIHPLAGCTENDHLQALVPVLNSPIASFLIQYLGKKSARKLFPKIVLDDLRQLLLPKSFLSVTHELISFTIRGNLPADEQHCRIDDLVLQAYELPGHVCDTIRKFTKYKPSTLEYHSGRKRQAVGSP